MRERHCRRPRLPPRCYTNQAPSRDQGQAGGAHGRRNGPIASPCHGMRYPPASPLFASWPWLLYTGCSLETIDINLLSAPLTISLLCCHIKSFRQASRCSEAMARRRKEERQAGLASRGCETLGSFLLPCAATGVVPARGAVPDRCHAWGAAVDIRRDITAWVRRAERAADGSVVDVPRDLSVSPRAP